MIISLKAHRHIECILVCVVIPLSFLIRPDCSFLRQPRSVFLDILIASPVQYPMLLHHLIIGLSDWLFSCWSRWLLTGILLPHRLNIQPIRPISWFFAEALLLRRCQAPSDSSKKMLQQSFRDFVRQSCHHTPAQGCEPFLCHHAEGCLYYRPEN